MLFRSASGAACRAGSDCRSGICLQDGVCFGPCADDADCVAGDRCYSPGVFFIDDGGTALAADDVYSGVPTCLTDRGSDAPCDDLRHCPAGEACTPRLDDDGRTFVTRCRTAQGAGGPGAACDADADCQLGACTDGHCAGLCFAPADCAAGTHCEAGRYVLDDRGTLDPYDDLTADLGFCLP